MSYWTCTFDYGTWLQRDPSLASWADKRKALVDKLAPGDIVVCYIAKVGWVGLLRATGTARHDADASAFGDDYPIVAPVDPIVTVAPEQSMPARELPRPHPLLRQGEDNAGAPMPYLFQGSGIQLAEEPGAALIELLTTWMKNPPPPRTLKPSQTEYSATPVMATTASGAEVSIPGDDEDQDESVEDVDPAEVTKHSDTQRKLLQLGRTLGFTPWVTSGDQSKAALQDGTTLGELPGVTTHLPKQFDGTTNKTIRYIDAMWLDKAAIRAAFEVENSTSIYSGILRMADLLALQPNLDIPLYVVVPDERKDKALQEIIRPVFQNMQKPLSSLCRVLTYSAVDELVTLAGAAKGHLQVGVLNEYADTATDVG